jgi:hypothetical protein
MIQDTIRNIEARLKDSTRLSQESKAELLALLATLKNEVTALARTESSRAESITGFVNVSAHEATREDRNPRLLKLSLEGLESSVEGFESSHPTLVKSVNSICMMLSDLGI